MSGGVYLRRLAPAQHSSEETSQHRRAIGDTASDLTHLEMNPRPATSIACVKTELISYPTNSYLRIHCVKTK